MFLATDLQSFLIPYSSFLSWLHSPTSRAASLWSHSNDFSGLWPDQKNRWFLQASTEQVPWPVRKALWSSCFVTPFGWNTIVMEISVLFCVWECAHVCVIPHSVCVIPQKSRTEAKTPTGNHRGGSQSLRLSDLGCVIVGVGWSSPSRVYCVTAWSKKNKLHQF